MRCTAVEETIMFPGVDKEAVEAAENGEKECKGKQRKAEIGASSDCRDEDCRSEKDANGDFLRKAMGASGGVDHDEVANNQTSKDEIETKGFGFEVRKKCCKNNCGAYDGYKKGRAMAIVEVVTSFEIEVEGLIGAEEPGVHEAVSGVKHPDSDCHG